MRHYIASSDRLLDGGVELADRYRIEVHVFFQIELCKLGLEADGDKARSLRKRPCR
jgi:hypothetical protein